LELISHLVFESIQSVDRAGRKQASPTARFNQLVERAIKIFKMPMVLGDGRGTLDSDRLCPVAVPRYVAISKPVALV
jgi:hypothetical protein